MSGNIGTVIVLLLLICAVVLIVISMIKLKKEADSLLVKGTVVNAQGHAVIRSETEFVKNTDRGIMEV